MTARSFAPSSRPPRSVHFVFVAGALALLVLAFAASEAFAQKKGKKGGGTGGGGDSFGGLSGAPQSPVAPPAGGGGKKAQQAKGAKAGKGGGGGAGADAGVRIKREPYRPGAAEKRESELETQEGIRLEIVGGVADLDRVLTIRGDGLARYRENGRAVKEGKLGSRHLRELFHLLGRNGIQEMKTEYGEKDPAGDRVMTSLTVSHGKRTQKIISFNDPGDLHPPGYDTIVAALEDLVDLRLTPVTDRRRGGGVAVSCRLDRLVYDVSPEAEAGGGKLKPEKARTPADDDGFAATAEPPASGGKGGKGGKGAKKAGAGGGGAKAGGAEKASVLDSVYGIRVSLELLNQTRDPIDLRFPTEQKYELVVADESGAELSRWSTGRPFKLAEERFVLDAGRHLFYEETLPLRDSEGRRFKPGRYRLQYRLLSEPGARGEIEFEVVEPAAKKGPSSPVPTLPGGDE